MTPAEVAAKLRAFNEWRRGDEDIPQPDPRVIGEAIDAAVEMIDRLEAAEKERDALRAKIEAMERQEPAGYGVRYVEPANGEEDWDSIWMHRVFAEDHIKDFTQAYVDIGEPVGAITVVPLYALPGAKGEEK